MKRWLTTILFTILSISMIFPFGKAYAAPTVKQGSSNNYVWDIQYRLKILGHYPSQLDGVYGPRTTKAVRTFQYTYGLPVDGVVGPKTWANFKKFSVNAKELEMLAKVIHSEARGEPYVGQVAVGAVVMNRLQSPKFPNSVKSVIFQKGAFTAVDDGQYWLTPNKSAYRAAWEAVRGYDPTGGALFYFNPDTATSDWIWSRPQIKKIGRHIFTR